MPYTVTATPAAPVSHYRPPSWPRNSGAWSGSTITTVSHAPAPVTRRPALDWQAATELGSDMPVTTVSMPARGAIAPIHRYRPPTTITFRPVEDVSPGHEPTDLVTPEPEGLSTGAEPTDLVTPEPEGLSTGAKVAIGVAAAAVVGLSGWAIYRVSKRTRRGRR